MQHAGDARRDGSSGPALKESGPGLCKHATKARLACVAFGARSKGVTQKWTTVTGIL